MTQSIPQLPEIGHPFYAVYEGIPIITSTRETAWRCWQAALSQPMAPAGMPERREVKAAGPEDMKIYSQIAAGALSQRPPSKTLPDTWDGDRRDQWTDDIDDAHPMHSGAHEAYAMALEMVGARKSKYALVDLVCWLLQKSAPSIGTPTQGVDHG